MTGHSFTSLRAMLLFLSCTLGACHSSEPAPQMEPRVAVLSPSGDVEHANLIVVGTVSSVEARGRLPHSDGPNQLELREADINVESILKGSHAGPRLTFFYFANTGAWHGAAPNLLAPEQRCIFYLMPTGARFIRAVNDVYSSCIEVSSGMHRVTAKSTDRDVRQLIAEVLLVPGEKLNTEVFRASLHTQAALATLFVGRDETIRLLQDLLGHAEPAIRSRACIVLAEPPRNQKQCLASLIFDTASDPSDREIARKMMQVAQ